MERIINIYLPSASNNAGRDMSQCYSRCECCAHISRRTF